MPIFRHLYLWFLCLKYLKIHKIHPLIYLYLNLRYITRVSSPTLVISSILKGRAKQGLTSNNSNLQVLSIHQTPRGTIYLDDKGSKCIEFSPEKGVVRTVNTLGYGNIWKREDAVVTIQPHSISPDMFEVAA